MAKIKKIILLFLTSIVLFSLVIISGCNDDVIENCDLPYTRSLYLYMGNIFSTYASLCNGNVMESGLVVTDSDEENVVLSSGDVKSKDWATGIFVSEGFAYIANGGNGLMIIDISDRKNPFISGVVDTPGYANSVFIFEDRAYVADGEWGLQVIDISKKSSPKLLKTYDTPGYAFDVFVYEGKAYVADGEKGLQIIDIS